MILVTVRTVEGFVEIIVGVSITCIIDGGVYIKVAECAHNTYVVAISCNDRLTVTILYTQLVAVFGYIPYTVVGIYHCIRLQCEMVGIVTAECIVV